MTAPNTKASKIDRLLSRQADANTVLVNIYTEVRDGRVFDQATIKILRAAVASLEDDNKRLRKYLGSVLFHRRQLAVSNAEKPLPVIPPMNAFVPTLRIADTAVTDHTHTVPHDFSDGRWSRCKRCRKLKLALEGSGEGCIDSTKGEHQ